MGPTSVAQRHPGWKTKWLTAVSSSITISTTPLGNGRTSSGAPKPFRWRRGTGHRVSRMAASLPAGAPQEVCVAAPPAAQYRKRFVAPTKDQNVFPEATFVVGPRDSIEAVDAGASSLLGYSRDELLRMHGSD